MKQKTKTITGKVDGKTITRTIVNYQQIIPEQEFTEKRNIIREFEKMGYSEKEIVFD